MRDRYLDIGIKIVGIVAVSVALPTILTFGFRQFGWGLLWQIPLTIIAYIALLGACYLIAYTAGWSYCSLLNIYWTLKKRLKGERNET